MTVQFTKGVVLAILHDNSTVKVYISNETFAKSETVVLHVLFFRVCHFVIVFSRTRRQSILFRSLFYCLFIQGRSCVMVIYYRVSFTYVHKASAM